MTDPHAWGVSDGFFDVSGSWRPADPDSLQAVLDSMGVADAEPPPPALVTVRLDHPMPSLGRGLVTLEYGGEVTVDGHLPPDLPAGYHVFQPEVGEAHPLVASPGRVPVPPEPRWGLSAQLYATRSHASWGIGDLADLQRLARWSEGLGAHVVLINPLPACSPTGPQQPSPYYAGSRCFFNPVYLSVDQVPGADRIDGDLLGQLGRAGRHLNADRLIDRDRVWELKSRALEALFADFRGSAAFDGFRAERGRSLELFALFCALAELHGSEWQQWAAGLRGPEGVAVERFAQSRRGRPRVTFYCWLQWLLDGQMSSAAGLTGIVQDLPVGVDPTGPDSWLWQSALAGSMRIGAPPDDFNTLGQNWGLPPFDPWRLRAGGYRPWIEALRAGLRNGCGLRIDHVMGLFRLYWIPLGATPAAGIYVRYPHHDMLNLLALEAHRAGAFVVGEDLGTVEDEVRQDLAERRVMSSRVWWFEDHETRDWPSGALASISTHDLPTVAGVFTGCDLEAQHRIGTEPNEELSAGLRHKIVERTGCDDECAVGEVIARVHADLGRAPCSVLVASLDDALAVEERPNMPGTTDEWPNWRLALPVPLDDFPSVLLFKDIAGSLTRRAGGP